MDNKLDYSKLYRKLIREYGNMQVAVAIEELSELSKELCKELRRKPNRNSILEEMADVYIMLEQMKLYFGLTDKEVYNMIVEKNERTLDRLDGGKL